ncbi:MAG TPA: hypothetical protein VMS31_02145 [Pyrinomonadaceae bacterium]|nr:hypothetical protein [Pyrinomonadaceae bacterium]
MANTTSSAAEKDIERVLNLLTRAPAASAESFTLGVKKGGTLSKKAGAAHSKRASAAARNTRMREIVQTKNVVAVGISEKVSKGKRAGKLALTFYVEHKVPIAELADEVAVPESVPNPQSGANAIPTDVKVIGKLRPEVNATRKRFQPGNSVGHVEASAGTLGAVVTKNDAFHILSNSHVLALGGMAKKGDLIVYPGIADGGDSEADLVAKLTGFKKFDLSEGFRNRVDCAIAKPTAERLGKLMSEIKGLGLPKGTTKPVRGMKVTKVGRTTGKTTGVIQDVHFRFKLDYEGDIGEVGFVDQVLCSRYTEPGDSGSLVIEKATGRAVGLHFAGASGGSVFNPIDEVVKALGVKLVTKSITAKPLTKKAAKKKKSPK